MKLTKTQQIVAATAALLVLPKLLFAKGKGSGNATGNLGAFLKLIQYCEGTYSQSNPYAVCYGYSHTIQNFSNHPAITGEWTGKTLPDSYCIAAGFQPGCKSTAAGAYQFLKSTWLGIQQKLGNIAFNAAGQDAGAVQLIKNRGAYNDVLNGNLYAAIQKCNKTWASLPGSPYGQPTKTYAQCEKFYIEHGGGVFS